ncbi:MAG: phenylacetate--CoA ligase [Bacteroidota bacterium]
MIYQPEIETMPLPKLRKLQGDRLRDIVAYVYQKVPFYKQKLDDAGVKPGDIKTMADLPKLPFTTKDDLRDNYPFGLFAVSQDKVSRIHCSSGTTGKPTVVGYTQNDLNIFSEVNARSLAAAGATPGMKLHNAYGYGLFTGGLGLHYGAEHLGMAVIPVSGGMTDRQLMLLQDFKSEVICCTPSYAQTLAEEISKRNLDRADFGLKYAVLGAEPWTETIRSQVEQGLGVEATNIYGLSEIIGPGVSQEDYEEKGTGSHVWEDHFFPEVIDPDSGEPLPEGKDGVLVFTTLTKEALPLLRYRTNDICSLHYDTDSKRTHIKMSQIKGRADDMIIIRGVNFFHTQIESLIDGADNLTPFYQVILTREGTMDEVELRIEVSQSRSHEFQADDQGQIVIQNNERAMHLAQAFREKIKRNIGLSMKVSLYGYDKIPRSEGGKLSRVVDLRKIL